MYRIIDLLRSSELEECRRIAERASFVDGKITNPHAKAKNNEQLHEPNAYQQSSQLLLAAFSRSREFVDFAFPVKIAPPLITRYKPGMHYGAHADTAFIQLPHGQIRSDVSCTIFLNDPTSYEGGALRIRLADADLRFKLKPGQAIVYPSDTLHEVEPVTQGDRLVAITFIQSRLPDAARRHLLYELNEVAALEGDKMAHDNFMRLQVVQQNLLRLWGDPA